MCGQVTPVGSFEQKGFFSKDFSHYEDMPVSEAQKVMSEYENSRNSEEE